MEIALIVGGLISFILLVWFISTLSAIERHLRNLEGMKTLQRSNNTTLSDLKDELIEQREAKEK